MGGFIGKAKAALESHQEIRAVQRIAAQEQEAERDMRDRLMILALADADALFETHVVEGVPAGELSRTIAPWTQRGWRVSAMCAVPTPTGTGTGYTVTLERRAFTQDQLAEFIDRNE